MPFNSALSGLRASSTDLKVTGNNIANASTVGFKASRVEFGDVYAASVLGAGLNQTGGGSRVEDIAQQFQQGNISFTQNELDLAISGTGFFVLDQGGEQVYSRAGSFSLNDQGYVVNNSGAELQGFATDGLGNFDGFTSGIQINTGNQDPRATTKVTSQLNLDSTEVVKQRNGITFGTGESTILQAPVVQDIANGIEGNGYGAQQFSVTGPTGAVSSYTSSLNASAAQTASELNSLAGVSASASTEVTLLNTSQLTTTGTTEVVLNNVYIAADGLADFAAQINELTASTLPGISATVDVDGNVTITSAVGSDIDLTLKDPQGGDQLVIANNDYDAVANPASTVTLSTADAAVSVGGLIDIVVEEGYTFNIESASAATDFIVQADLDASTDFTINAFNPDDPATYNHATSLTVYDSLGEQHVMTQYFVKNKYDPTDADFAQPNAWTMHVLIDGEDVGDPDTTLPPPENTVATRASFQLYFNADGSLNTSASEKLLISNWTPLNEDGDPNGALGPLNVIAGGQMPVEEPATSSNFSIDMASTTQFGSDFSVSDVEQNGYQTGLLTGLNIDDSGIIYARYTNGESIAISQIAMANFDNSQGLQPLGESLWAENFESGVAVIGQPGTGALGVIQAGALEESNVDLSEQLVNLIVAQRNFQANAKTIETANQITQTIINLR